MDDGSFIDRLYRILELHRTFKFGLARHFTKKAAVRVLEARLVLAVVRCKLEGVFTITRRAFIFGGPGVSCSQPHFVYSNTTMIRRPFDCTEYNVLTQPTQSPVHNPYANTERWQFLLCQFLHVDHPFLIVARTFRTNLRLINTNVREDYRLYRLKPRS